MRRIIKNSTLIILGLIVLGLVVLALENLREAKSRNQKYEARILSKTEKGLIDEALWLKKVRGDQVWPGLSEADIPVILFNDRYEFLVGMKNPPPAWTKVEGNTFNGNAYFRKPVHNPQAFAVQVGNKWAGSLGTPNRMNREYFLGIRSKLPPVIAQLFPYQYATVTPDMHVVGILHEVFHAFQASASPAHFTKANESYSAEENYPYSDQNLNTLWNLEGYYLWKAMNADQTDSIRTNVKKFLTIRQERRIQGKLSAPQINFERNTEWLEGLAKYTEYRFYELATVRRNKPILVHYRKTIPQQVHDLNTLKSKLGEQGSDFRFYVSGMAQAKILDKLSPGWKTTALNDTISLEDLLKNAVTQ